MRKGLVSFIIILCMLIPLAVGCQNNTAVPTVPSIAGEGTTSPDKMDAQTTAPLPEFTEPGTEDSEMTEPQEAESSTPTVTPDPTAPQTTEPVIQETEPDATDAPTEPPGETDPPATEEPEHTEPKPKPTEPTPTTPAPTEPKPTDPPATEPPATEPAEVIDLDALVQYGLNYAANTHGYEISPGLRDGYYPAYTCVISTMEEGRAAVRGCIDDTTRALLARPGNHIVVEIDGVICRARIDIAIVPKDEGTYLISVYYG